MKNKIFLGLLPLAFIFSSCNQENKNTQINHTITGQMQLEYANQFSVEYCSDGCSIININDEKYLLSAENNPEHADSEPKMQILFKGEKNIYLAASSAMDLLGAINSLDNIGFTSTSASNWSLEYIKNAVEEEDIFYVGKYSAPDYEFLLSEGCNLAIESTMINHTPEVKEQLQKIGITVMTERSSYETHPLGRMEWIKLYGIITGKEDEAEKFWREKTDKFKNILSDTTDKKKTAVFFYITSSGCINVRKPGDYISKMIELAGGKYLFENNDLGTDENEFSAVNMQMEDFYVKAKDADILIYNSAIEGAPENIEQLITENPLFSEFKAIKNGDIWFTGQNLFQQTSCTADMIEDIYSVIHSNTEDDLKFLKLLR